MHSRLGRQVQQLWLAPKPRNLTKSKCPDLKPSWRAGDRDGGGEPGAGVAGHAVLAPAARLRILGLIPEALNLAGAQAIVTVVENQALVWLGTLYSPLLPVFGLLANMVQFYTKLLLALVAYEPPSERYSVSRTSVMAYTLMLGARPRTPAMENSLLLARLRTASACAPQRPH